MNKNKIILIIALILVIVTGIYLISSFINSHRKLGDMPESIDGKTAENQLLLNGIGIFAEKYTGSLKRTDITADVSTIIKEYIPELYKDVKNKDEKGIEKYYNSNKSEIEERFGIGKLEDFSTFVNGLKSSQVNLNDYYKLNIDKESFIDKYDKDYAYMECFVTYGEDESEKIDFTLYVAMNTYTDPKYIIGIK